MGSKRKMDLMIADVTGSKNVAFLNVLDVFRIEFRMTLNYFWVANVGLPSLPCLKFSPEMIHGIHGSGLRGPLSIDSFLVGGASLCSALEPGAQLEPKMVKPQTPTMPKSQ